jgi:hypothetical protein
MEIDFSGLSSLLNASSKIQVKQLIRFCSKRPIPVYIRRAQEDLNLSDTELYSLLNSLQGIVVNHMRGFDIEWPAGFHPQLKELILKLLQDLEEELLSISDQPRLPRFRSIDWRVDACIACSGLEKNFSIPKVCFEVETDESKVSFSLSKAKLQLMVETLGKVKESLDSLAGVE